MSMSRQDIATSCLAAWTASQSSIKNHASWRLFAGGEHLIAATPSIRTAVRATRPFFPCMHAPADTPRARHKRTLLRQARVLCATLLPLLGTEMTDREPRTADELFRSLPKLPRRMRRANCSGVDLFSRERNFIFHSASPPFEMSIIRGSGGSGERY